MNTPRLRLAMWMAFLFTGKLFDIMISGHPRNEDGWTFYYASAATVDLMMFHSVKLFIAGRLGRDIEALCIASIITNALGWALYLAWKPPTIYNNLIHGLNYVLAIRLLIGDGNVLDYSYWRDLVSSALNRRGGQLAKEAKR